MRILKKSVFRILTRIVVVLLLLAVFCHVLRDENCFTNEEQKVKYLISGKLSILKIFFFQRGGGKGAEGGGQQEREAAKHWKELNTGRNLTLEETRAQS